MFIAERIVISYDTLSNTRTPLIHNARFALPTLWPLISFVAKTYVNTVLPEANSATAAPSPPSTPVFHTAPVNHES